MKSAAKKNGKSRSQEVVVPDKLYFRIGEVADLADVPTYVLRFWETEFPHIKATKGSTGQRAYRRKDVENILQVKKLLYDEGYTIQGARQFLKTESRTQRSQNTLPFVVAGGRGKELRDIRNGLRDILSMLAARR
jgi:DNA-binding transcriptional MerR regulator